jgi:hypothetical protein
MQSDEFPDRLEPIEPISCTIPRTVQITGDSRSVVYQLIGRGLYEAVKSGRRTLITFASIKRRIAGLPKAAIKPPAPRALRAFPTEAPRPRRGRKSKATRAARASSRSSDQS